MAEEFLTLEGLIVSPNALALSRARALAGLLATGRLPYVKLVECQTTRQPDGNASDETVVLDVIVERPQQPVNDIRHTERIAVTFAASDRIAPEVVSLRLDFPWVPHVNLRTAEYPRSLCLYDRPWSEISSRWTPAVFVERVRQWLTATARGELHQDDQPLEPLLLHNGLRIILPADIYKDLESNAPVRLDVCMPNRSKDCRTLFALRSSGSNDSPVGLRYIATTLVPVLVDKCYSCHSAKAGDVQGGLLLDSREGIRRGGDSGAAVVPGNLQASLLTSAIRYANDDLKMPPKDDGGKLPDSVIGDFETWVRMGAPDPRDGASKVVTRYDTSQARKWWSFQRLKSVTGPSTTIATQFAMWPKSDIDRFVAAQWERTKLSPVADAEPLVLLRRLRFDLTGLPPSDQECEDFLKRWSSSGDRESLLKETVDRLLDSREYAERWGRHWLDVARYAESSGKDANLVYPHAWRYRDYVIDSFDKDKPFDQFVREQIAGDLLQRPTQLGAASSSTWPGSSDARWSAQWCWPSKANAARRSTTTRRSEAATKRANGGRSGWTTHAIQRL